MSEDDVAYHRSARNMGLVLAAIVLTVFSAIFIPPLVNPVREEFLTSASVNSPYGFSLNLNVPNTILAPGENIQIRASMDNTGSQIDNITSNSHWSLPPSDLNTGSCNATESGWPLAVGVLAGYYSIDNVSKGTVVGLSDPRCVWKPAPAFFAIQPRGSRAIVSSGGKLVQWDLQVSLTINQLLGPGGAPLKLSGVYTVIAADEWGDVVLTHFRANS